MNCHYCNTQEDLRPYGPKGTMTCFDCAVSTPERKTETANNFATQLAAVQGPVVLDGSHVGPYPAEHHAVVKRYLFALESAK